MRMPKAPLADFSSNAPLKLFFSQGSAEVGYFPAVLVIFAVRMDAHAVLQSETSHLQVVSRAQKPVSPKGFELKYRELLSENMFERPCE